MNLKRSASNHPIKIIQNRIIFWQEERGVSYEKGDGVINIFDWLCFYGYTLRDSYQVYRKSFISSG
jgi:hypothetical protein